MRFRNKLSLYDLLEGHSPADQSEYSSSICGVKDTTDGSADAKFEDYGLYTQVEQL